MIGGNNMEKTKKCPTCLKDNEISAKQCSECGFEFYVPEVKEEVVSLNNIVSNDPTPEFLWKFISFLCPIAGLVFFIIWREKWPRRAAISGKAAMAMAITIFVLGIILLAVMIGIKHGDINV